MPDEVHRDRLRPRGRARAWCSCLGTFLSGVAAMGAFVVIAYVRYTDQRAIGARPSLQDFFEEYRQLWQGWRSSSLDYALRQRRHASNGAYLPTEQEIDDLLRPLEARCFTYLPTTWTRNNRTHSNLFTFQWCHDGRATVHIQRGRRRLQIDLGAKSSTTIALEPIDRGWTDEEVLFPAIVHHFSGGSPCERPAEGREGEGDAAPEDRETVSDAIGLSVHLWCCGAVGGGRGVLGGAQIVNLVEVGQNAGPVRQGGDGRALGEDDGGGEASASMTDAGNCSTFVASVCTHLLCPVYPEIAVAKPWYPLEVKHGDFETPPPPTVVSRRHRGFREYDRRKVMTPDERVWLREEVREMFVHSYDGYMRHALPSGELLPVTCESGELHLVKLPFVTLVDTMDTLAIMGNASEFRLAVRLVSEGLDVDTDVDVSVFESNIRLLGGLLSAHLFATDPALNLYPPRCPREDVGKSSVAGKESWNAAGEVALEGSQVSGGAAPRHNDAFGSGRSSTRSAESIEGRHEDTQEARKPGRADDRGGAEACQRSRQTSAGDYVAWALGGGDGREIDGDCAHGRGEFEEYGGELLALAEELGRRMLPAFETPTGIPFGTVNLMTGVPEGETSISSLAGAGSLAVEFSVLSALTGDGVFAEAAEGAVKALFNRRSAGLGLLGKHIDTSTGVWTEPESGIGTNGDSFYEYLLKMDVLWGDSEYWDMFMQAYSSIQRFVREGDWYAGVEISAGVVTSRTFDNLMAFWPGMQALAGDVHSASRTLNSMYQIWRDWGFLPEQFDHVRWELKKRGVGRAYPLRPELIESTLHVYKATGDASWLWAGKDFLESIKLFCRTDCGYAGIRDVGDGSLDQQMPSFFLSETLKYLYLLFDEGNFVHKGNYVFSTEAHPFPIDAVRQGGYPPCDGGNAHLAGSKRRTKSPDRGEDRRQQADYDHHQQNHRQREQPEESCEPAATSPSASAVTSCADPGAPSDVDDRDDHRVRRQQSGGSDRGTWAAWRAKVGEGYQLGPDGWSDGNMLFWVEGAGGLADRTSTPVAMRAELSYTRMLWEMYMTRMCPVMPWWLAPYRYTPLKFEDALTAGGRSIWLAISTDGEIEASGQTEDACPGEETRNQSYFVLDGVGLIVVTANGNEFTVSHPDTGEALIITQAFGYHGGPGLPGGQGAGAIHVTGYVRSKKQTRAVPPARKGSARSTAGPVASRARVSEKPEIDDLVAAPPDTARDRGLGGGCSNDASCSAPSGELGVEGTAEALPTGGLARQPDLLQPKVADLSSTIRGEANADADAADANAAPLVSSLRTILVTKEGLAVYCSLSLLLRTYPCAVATFSPPGAGLTIIPPMEAPFRIVDGLGCEELGPEETRSPDGASGDQVSTTRASGDEEHVHLPAGTVEEMLRSRTFRRPWRRRQPQATANDIGGSEGEDAASGVPGKPEYGRDRASGDAEDYDGTILVVFRGQCTFEEKARVAERMGAVGVVIINNKPGEHPFPMQGQSGKDEDSPGVGIPVVMVGLEDGMHLREDIHMMDTGRAQPRQGVLDVRTSHERFVTRLAREQREGLRDAQGVWTGTPGVDPKQPEEGARRHPGVGEDARDSGKSETVSISNANAEGVPYGGELASAAGGEGDVAGKEEDVPRGEGVPAVPLQTSEYGALVTESRTSSVDTTAAFETPTKVATTGGRRSEIKSSTGAGTIEADGQVTGSDISQDGRVAGIVDARVHSDLDWAQVVLGMERETPTGVGDEDVLEEESVLVADRSVREGDESMMVSIPEADELREISEQENTGHGFSFLASGFDDVTLGGMRPPPFFLPKVIVQDGVVQVMGRGHWGVLVFVQEGTWGLSLMHNPYNPPPPPKRQKGRSGNAARVDTDAEEREPGTSAVDAGAHVLLGDRHADTGKESHVVDAGVDDDDDDDVDDWV